MQTARLVALLTIFLGAVIAQESPSDRGKSLPVSEHKLGTVCVLTNSPDPPTRISPGGEYNPATLTVRIDKGESVRWQHKSPVRIENLSLNERHLVVLTSDGKPIQSLWFRFSDYKDVKLCIYFDGYQGVQLGDNPSALWCRCK